MFPTRHGKIPGAIHIYVVQSSDGDDVAFVQPDRIVVVLLIDAIMESDAVSLLVSDRLGTSPWNSANYWIAGALFNAIDVHRATDRARVLVEDAGVRRARANAQGRPPPPHSKVSRGIADGIVANLVNWRHRGRVVEVRSDVPLHCPATDVEHSTLHGFPHKEIARPLHRVLEP